MPRCLRRGTNAAELLNNVDYQASGCLFLPLAIAEHGHGPGHQRLLRGDDEDPMETMGLESAADVELNKDVPFLCCANLVPADVEMMQWAYWELGGMEGMLCVWCKDARVDIIVAFDLDSIRGCPIVANCGDSRDALCCGPAGMLPVPLSYASVTPALSSAGTGRYMVAELLPSMGPTSSASPSTSRMGQQARALPTPSARAHPAPHARPPWQVLVG
jgi:hypothetical protein